MGENCLIGAAIGIVLFLAGVFAKDKYVQRKQVREQVQAAQEDEMKGAEHAREKYEERIKAAELSAKLEVGTRPRTGDAGADLSDRLQRHAEFIRRRDARKRARRQSDGRGR